MVKYDLSLSLSSVVQSFTKGPHCGLPGAPSASGAALCVESALNPATTSRKTQKMAAMEHRKRSKAAIDMIGHCGSVAVSRQQRS